MPFYDSMTDYSLHSLLSFDLTLYKLLQLCYDIITKKQTLNALRIHTAQNVACFRCLFSIFPMSNNRLLRT